MFLDEGKRGNGIAFFPHRNGHHPDPGRAIGPITSGPVWRAHPGSGYVTVHHCSAKPEEPMKPGFSSFTAQ